MPEKPARSLPKEIKTIAIFRANALSDFIFCTPLIRALDAHYPKAKITYIGMDSQRDLIETRYPEIDEILVVPDVGETEYIEDKDWDKLFDFAKSLRGKFDLFLQLHDGSAGASKFTSLTESRWTMGYSNDPTAPLDVVLPNTYLIHEVIRHLEFLCYLNVPIVEFEPFLKLQPHDWEELEHQFGVDDRPIVIIHPGAGDPRRRWPVEKFAEVGDWVAQQGYRVVITSTLEEVLLAEEMRGLMKEDADSTGGILSLASFIGLLSVAKLFISNDTGPLHIARAMGIPNVAIYAPTNVAHTGPLSATNNRILVSCIYNCPKCGKDLVCKSWHRYHDERYPDECNHDTSLVSDVRVEDCINVAQSMLK